jgi:superfamily II RNA helicase
MVKICSDTFSTQQEDRYSEHFEKYPFPLSSFQKYAIEAIVEGHHILVTAHTGSGKTLPAEFAIEHFVSQGKKVIYTSPIKALSNQKFYEFTKKFPGISFGVITGDIKCNPEADVLIMTTEILLNKLYQTSGTKPKNMSFDMDIEKELACVIFDEVHYINDADRGKVWEQSIMMLPLNIQMVMLSATIDQPEKFALWCETRGSQTTSLSSNKKVYLTTTYERVVPLTHYSFITTNNGIFKAIKDKDLEKQIKDSTNTLFTIQNSKGVFDEVHYHKMKKMLDLFANKQVFVKRAHVLNQVCKHMVENDMLPALCFVLSRKQLEACAREITQPLLEFDSKVGYIVRRECEQIMRKLPNYQEYLELPEYLNMVSLLEKGIAIHHAGVMPVLREMVELLYAKGYIKLLFATETFAVGINMPTKTTLFTSLEKFDGSGMRMLYSHEYTQMAGRAGRRGLDKIGNVIHLNNLFKNMNLLDYKQMMCGKPQTLVSKFKISYNLILNLIDVGDKNFAEFAKRSMIQSDIDAELGKIYYKMADLQSEIDKSRDSINYLKTPKYVLEEYIDLSLKRPTSTNKKRKDIEKRMQDIRTEYFSLDNDLVYAQKYISREKELVELDAQFKDTEQFLNKNVLTIFDFLKETDFVKTDEEGEISLTFKGSLASNLREVHCLAFANILEQKSLEDLDPRQMVAVFSCFANVTTSDEKRSFAPYCEDKKVQNVMLELKQMYESYMKIEDDQNVNTGTDYNMQFDLMTYLMEWCDAKNVTECKLVLQKMEKEKEIFLGEFVKALLKINNISSEMEKICETMGSVAFLSKLREIPNLTLKFVATNQSLYV